MCGDHALDFRRRPLVMGILNITPDSFHAASRVEDAQDAAARATEMAAAGADLLDLGAESSRPGAVPLGVETEMQRLLPALEAVRSACDLPITVDTYNAETADAALALGADGINDISASALDDRMLPLAADRGCGLVLMHMRGTPESMQDRPTYEDPLREIAAHLAERTAAARAAGVRGDRIVIDPGIGFGKTLAHNLALLAGLEIFTRMGPVLLGASRKSFIGRLTGAEPDDRLGGSLAAAATAMSAGAAVVRVHDVGQTVQMLDVLAAIEASRGD